MKKNFFTLLLVFFFISCSQLTVKPMVLSSLEKINLENNITDFKASLKNNNFFEVTNFFENNYRTRKALTFLETIDFSNITIFSSKVDFSKKKPTNTLGFSYSGETFYYYFSYTYKNKKWKISTIATDNDTTGN